MGEVFHVGVAKIGSMPVPDFQYMYSGVYEHCKNLELNLRRYFRLLLQEPNHVIFMLQTAIDAAECR